MVEHPGLDARDSPEPFSVSVGYEDVGLRRHDPGTATD
jgi:hypothetical protein